MAMGVMILWFLMPTAIAKQLFKVRGVDEAGTVVIRRKPRRL
jgi:hypothetical protein